MENKVLKNAFNKIQHHYKKIYCASLTACELLELIKIGCWLIPTCAYKLELAKDQKAKGDCNPRWYYFHIPKTLIIGDKKHG
jgi:hypothetical protein